MKLLISVVALAAGLGACAHSTDMATRTTAPAMVVASADEPSKANKGQVTIGGIEPSRVLGAIDTAKLVKNPDIGRAGDPAATTDASRPGTGKGISVEGLEPAAVLAAIDTSKLVGDGKTPPNTATPARSAEVQAVVGGKKKYTTKDLAQAQLDAVKKGGG